MKNFTFKKAIANSLSELVFSIIQQPINQYEKFVSQEIQSNPDTEIGLSRCIQLSNGQLLQVYCNSDSTFSYFLDGQWNVSSVVCQKLHQFQDEIKRFEAMQAYQVRDEKQIQIIYFNVEKKIKYIGELTDDQIIKVTQTLMNADQAFKFLKENEKNLFYDLFEFENQQKIKLRIDMQSGVFKFPLEWCLNQIELDENELLKIEIQELKNQVANFQMFQLNVLEKLEKLTQQVQVDFNKIQELKNINEQLKVAFKINDTFPLQSVTIEDFKFQDQVYYTKRYAKENFQLSLVLEDEEIESTILVLREGDMTNKDALARAFYFSFPSGHFRRGSQKSLLFINYPFKKNDLIQLQVDIHSHFITLKINGYFCAPIQIPSDFEDFAFLVYVDKQKRIEDVFKMEELEVQQGKKVKIQ